MILGDAIEGEAREVAKVLAGIAQQVRRHGQPAPAPCVLLSGGETTRDQARARAAVAATPSFFWRSRSS